MSHKKALETQHPLISPETFPGVLGDIGNQREVADLEANRLRRAGAGEIVRKSNPCNPFIIQVDFPDTLQGMVEREIVVQGCQNQPANQKNVDYRLISNEDEGTIGLTYGFDNYTPIKMHDLGIRALLGARVFNIDEDSRLFAARNVAASLVAKDDKVMVQDFDTHNSYYEGLLRELRENGTDHLVFSTFSLHVMTFETPSSKDAGLADVYCLEERRRLGLSRVALGATGGA